MTGSPLRPSRGGASVRETARPSLVRLRSRSRPPPSSRAARRPTSNLQPRIAGLRRCCVGGSSKHRVPFQRDASDPTGARPWARMRGPPRGDPPARAARACMSTFAQTDAGRPGAAPRRCHPRAAAFATAGAPEGSARSSRPPNARHPARAQPMHPREGAAAPRARQAVAGPRRCDRRAARARGRSRRGSCSHRHARGRSQTGTSRRPTGRPLQPPPPPRGIRTRRGPAGAGQACSPRG